MMGDTIRLPTDHEGAINMILDCSTVSPCSYEEAIALYLRARGILNDEVGHLCAPIPDDWTPGGLPKDDISQAARDVLAERKRQVTEEGWTPDHDDAHIHGELARAAACYAAPQRMRDPLTKWLWPWADTWWKPAAASDFPAGRRRELIKAGALIIAEIERIDRAEALRAETPAGKDAQDADTA